MKVSFRQGIVRRQSDTSNSGSFLRRASSGNSIDLIVSPDITVVTFAHYDANYLVEELSTVRNAWSGMDVAQIYYLYWDMNILTGALTRSWTLLAPVVGDAPTNPAVDQHWFDMSTTTMRVWSGKQWIDKARVFAAVYNGATIVPYPLGSQVGIDEICLSGVVMLGADSRPLRHSNGTLFTSETSVIMKNTSNMHAKFDSTITYVQSVEEIAKFSCVSILPGRKVRLADNLDVARTVQGLVTEDMYENDVAALITSGYIRNANWAWGEANVGKPLFCGANGVLTVTRPTHGFSQIVGHVDDVDTIFVHIEQAVKLIN